MYQLNFATPNFNNNVSDVNNIPTTSWEECIGELLYGIQRFGGKDLEKIAVLEKIQDELGIKQFSKITRKLGWARKEISKFFLRLQGSMCVPRGVEQIATNQQLERLAKFHSEKIIDYVVSVTNQADLDAAIKKYTKEVVDPNKPPKTPKPAIGWERKQGGGRKARCEFQDTENTRAFMAGWEEVKGEMTADAYLASGAWIDKSEEKEYCETEVVKTERHFWEEEVNPVDNDTNTVDIPVATEIVEVVEVVEETLATPVEEVPVEEEVPIVEEPITPPQMIEKRPLPVNKNRWKSGWKVGMRCLPKFEINDARQYEWTNGEFPLITEAHGEVGSIQVLTLQRSDGETIQSYGNWVDDEPTVPNDIVYQRKLRECRTWFKTLMHGKPTDNDDLIKTGRGNYEHFKYRFQEWGKENREYAEAIFTEIQQIEAKLLLQLTGC